MKIYYPDFWFILYIKLARRVQPQKRNIDKNNLLSRSATGLFIYSYSILVFSISLPIINILGDFTKETILYSMMGVCILLYLIVYWRYLRNDEWKKIERQIELNYSKKKRDQIFFGSVFIYLIFYSVFLAVFFSIMVPCK